MSRPPFTRETVLTFTQGHCHLLALELHKRTGWSLAGCLDVPDHWEGAADDPDYWAHVVCLTPGGHYIDISGIHTAPHLSTLWDGCHIHTPEPDLQERTETYLRDYWCTAGDDVPQATVRRQARRLVAMWQDDPTPREFVPATWFTANEDLIAF